MQALCSKKNSTHIGRVYSSKNTVLSLDCRDAAQPGGASAGAAAAAGLAAAEAARIADGGR